MTPPRCQAFDQRRREGFLWRVCPLLSAAGPFTHSWLLQTHTQQRDTALDSLDEDLPHDVCVCVFPGSIGGGWIAQVSSSRGETGHCPSSRTFSCIMYACNVRPWSWLCVWAAWYTLYQYCPQPWEAQTGIHLHPAGQRRRSRSFLHLSRIAVLPVSNEDWWGVGFSCR